MIRTNRASTCYSRRRFQSIGRFSAPSRFTSGPVHSVQLQFFATGDMEGLAFGHSIVPRVGVTGITFHHERDSVYACIGDSLCEFDFDGRVLGVSRIAPAGNVLHGVLHLHKETWVFGGRFVSLLREKETTASVQLPDWILSVAKHAQELVAVLARGFLAIVSSEGTSFRLVKLPVPALLSCAVVESRGSSLVIAAGTFAGQVKRWHVGADDAVTEEGETLCFGSAVYSLALVQGSEVVCGCDDRAVHGFGKSLFGHGGRIWDLKMTDDGFLVAAGEDGTLRWWNGSSARFDETVSASRSSVRRIAVRGCFVACGGDDGTISVWRKPQPSEPEQCFVLPSKARALKVDVDGAVWCAIDGALLKGSNQVYERPKNPIIFIGCSDNQSVLVGHKNGLICKLDVANWKIQCEARVCSSAVMCSTGKSSVLVASHDGFTIVEANGFGQVFVQQKLFSDKKESVTACCLAADDQVAVIGTSKGALVVCNLITKEILRQQSHSDTVTDVSMQGQMVLASCRDGRLGTWIFREQCLVLLSMERPLAGESCESFVGEAMMRVHTQNGASVCRVRDYVLIARIPNLLPRCLFDASLVGKDLIVACCLPGQHQPSISVFRFSAESPHVRVLQHGGHAVTVNCAVRCGAEALLATSDDEGRIGFWRGSGVELRKCGSQSIRAMCFWESGQSLLAASASRLFVWQNERLVRSVALSSNESAETRRVMWLVPFKSCVLFGDSTGHVGVVRLLATGIESVPCTRIGDSCLASGCSIGNDGACVVSTSGMAHWLAVDDLNGTILHVKSMYVGRSSLAAIISTPWYLVCAGDDGTRGWILRPDSDQAEEFVLGHVAAVVCLQISGSDELISLSNDQTVRVFYLNNQGPRLKRVIASCVAQPSSMCYFEKRIVVCGSLGFDLIEN